VRGKAALMGDDFGFGDGVSLEGVVVVFSAGVRRVWRGARSRMPACGGWPSAWL